MFAGFFKRASVLEPKGGLSAEPVAFPKHKNPLVYQPLSTLELQKSWDLIDHDYDLFYTLFQETYGELSSNNISVPSEVLNFAVCTIRTDPTTKFLEFLQVLTRFPHCRLALGRSDFLTSVDSHIYTLIEKADHSRTNLLISTYLNFCCSGYGALPKRQRTHQLLVSLVSLIRSLRNNYSLTLLLACRLATALLKRTSNNHLSFFELGGIDLLAKLISPPCSKSEYYLSISVYCISCIIDCLARIDNLAGYLHLIGCFDSIGSCILYMHDPSSVVYSFHDVESYDSYIRKLNDDSLVPGLKLEFRSSMSSRTLLAFGEEMEFLKHCLISQPYLVPSEKHLRLRTYHPVSYEHVTLPELGGEYGTSDTFSCILSMLLTVLKRSRGSGVRLRLWLLEVFHGIIVTGCDGAVSAMRLSGFYDTLCGNDFLLFFKQSNFDSEENTEDLDQLIVSSLDVLTCSCTTHSGGAIIEIKCLLDLLETYYLEQAISLRIITCLRVVCKSVLGSVLEAFDELNGFTTLCRIFHLLWKSNCTVAVQREAVQLLSELTGPEPVLNGLLLNGSIFKSLLDLLTIPNQLNVRIAELIMKILTSVDCPQLNIILETMDLPDDLYTPSTSTQDIELKYFDLHRQQKILFGTFMEFMFAHRENANIVEICLHCINQATLSRTKYHQLLISNLPRFPQLPDLAYGKTDTLVVLVLNTIQAILNGNTIAMVQFNSGYAGLSNLLARVWKLDTFDLYLTPVLNLLVDGNFNIATAYILSNKDALNMLILIVRSKCDQIDFQRMLLWHLFQIVSLSDLNRTFCCEVGILDGLIHLFSECSNAQLHFQIIGLMELIASHSLTVEELKKWIKLMHPSDGKLFYYTPWLVSSLRAFYNKDGPKHLFYFDGIDSGLELSGFAKWPRNGYSLSLKFRVESHLGPHQMRSVNEKTQFSPRLLSFMTPQYTGLEVYLKEGCLFATLTAPEDDITNIPIALIEERTWYSLSMSHSIVGVFQKTSTFSVYLDGKLCAKAPCKYSIANEPVRKCFVGTDGSNAPHCFFGQMGTISMFSGSISESNPVTFRHSGNRARSMILGIDSRASIGDLSYFNIASNELDLIRARRGTTRCTLKGIDDIIYCCGGVRMLYPLISNLDLPFLRPDSSISGIPLELKEMDLLKEILLFFVDMTTGDEDCIHFLKENAGFRILSMILEQVSRKHLNFAIVSILEALLDNTRVDRSFFLQTFVDIFMNSKLWLYSNISTQRTWVRSIREIVRRDLELFSTEFGIQPFVDILQIAYGYYSSPDSHDFPDILTFGTCSSIKSGTMVPSVPNEVELGYRPGLRELSEIRVGIWTVIRLILNESLSFRDIQSLVYSMAESEDYKHILETGTCLLDILGADISVISHLNRLGGLTVFLNLLSIENEDLVVLGLQGIALLLNSTDTLDKPALWIFVYTRLSKLPYSTRVHELLLQLLAGPNISSHDISLGSVRRKEVFPIVFKLVITASIELKTRTLLDMRLLLQDSSNQKAFLSNFGWQTWLLDLLLHDYSYVVECGDLSVETEPERVVLLEVTLKLFSELLCSAIDRKSCSSTIDAFTYLFIYAQEKPQLSAVSALLLLLKPFVGLVSRSIERNLQCSRFFGPNIRKVVNSVEGLLVRYIREHSTAKDRAILESEEFSTSIVFETKLQSFVSVVQYLYELFKLSSPDHGVSGIAFIDSASMLMRLLCCLDSSGLSKSISHSNNMEILVNIFRSFPNSIISSYDSYSVSSPDMITKTMRRFDSVHRRESSVPLWTLATLFIGRVLGIFYDISRDLQGDASPRSSKLFDAELLRIHSLLRCLFQLFPIEFLEIETPLSGLHMLSAELCQNSSNLERFLHVSVEYFSTDWMEFHSILESISTRVENSIPSSGISKLISNLSTRIGDFSRANGELYSEFREVPDTNSHALSTKERSRRDMIQKMKTKRTSICEQNYKIMLALLENERGPWNISSSRVYYKLDERENSQRIRKKLVINHEGSDHEGALRLRRKVSALHTDSSDIFQTSTTFSILAEQRPDNQFAGEFSLEDDDKEVMEHSVAEYLVYRLEVEIIRRLDSIPGILELTNANLYFIASDADEHQFRDPRSFDSELSQTWKETVLGVKDCTWKLSDISQLALRCYLLQHCAIEMFLTDQTSVFFQMFRYSKRNRFYRKLIQLKPSNLRLYQIDSAKSTLHSSNMTTYWQRHEVSNFDYLMYLNSVSGRSYNDFTQYPIMPWIISDYSSPELDLTNPDTFRDLSKPVGALNPNRLAVFIERFKVFQDPVIPKFMYGTHYSNPGYVTHFLLRQEPYTTAALALQGGEFDRADRLFQSLADSWKGSLLNHGDVKELIPEFYFLPEMFKNSSNINFGVTQSGTKVNNVELPPWASSPEHFIRLHREALESDYVSQHLHEWIDLIWGFKQRGPEAVKASNLFFYMTYEGSVDLEKICDPDILHSTMQQISNFGQTPIQLLDSPHPRRLALEDPMPSMFLLSKRIGVYIELNVHRAFYVAQCASSIVTVSHDRYYSVHKWRAYVPECNPPFTLELDKGFRGPLGAEWAQSPTPRLVAVSGSHIYSCGHWNETLLCTSLDQKTQKNLHGHRGAVTCISKDQDRLVSGSVDTTCIIWSITTNLPLRVLIGHDAAVTAVSVQVDFDIVVSGSADSTCNIHSLHTGEYIRTLRFDHRAAIHLIAISSHGDIAVYSHGDRIIHVFSINGVVLNRICCHERLQAIVFSSCGKFLITGGEHMILIIRDAFTDHIIRRLCEPDASITMISVFDKDQHMAVCLYNGKVLIYSLEPSILRKQMFVKLSSLGF